MKRYLALLLAALMAVTLFGCGAAGESASGSDDDLRLLESGKLIVATESSFPPYEMPAEDGVGVAGMGLVGIDIEIAYEVAQRLGLELVVLDTKYDYALYAAQNGKADMVMMGLSDSYERKSFMLFSDPYAECVQVVIVPEDSEIDNPRDLAHRAVGVVRGTTSWVYCLDDYGESKVWVYDDYDAAVQALQSGLVEALVLEKVPAKDVLKTYDGLVTLKEAFTDGEYVIGLGKDNVGLQQAVNGVLADMEADGTLDAIIGRYIPTDPV